MAPVNFFQNRKRVVRGLIASLAAAALFTVILLFGGDATFPLMRVLAAVCVPVFTALSGYYLYRLLNKDKPLIVLDADGLTDRTNPFSIGLVRWDEIEDETGFMHNNLPTLRLDIENIDALLGRMPPGKRLAVRGRMLLMRLKHAVPVDVELTGLMPDDIIREMRNVRAAATGNPDPKHPRSRGGEPDTPDRAGGFSKYDA